MFFVRRRSGISWDFFHSLPHGRGSSLKTLDEPVD